MTIFGEFAPRLKKSFNQLEHAGLVKVTATLSLNLCALKSMHSCSSLSVALKICWKHVILVCNGTEIDIIEFDAKK